MMLVWNITSRRIGATLAKRMTNVSGVSRAFRFVSQIRDRRCGEPAGPQSGSVSQLLKNRTADAIPRTGHGLTSLRRKVERRLADVCSLRKLMKFFLVGASGIIVNNLLLSALYAGARLPILLASVGAVELTIVYNYLLDNRWAFQRRDISVHRFAKFNLASLGALLVTTTTLWFLVTDVGVHYLLANLIAIGAAGFVNLGGAAWTWGFGR